MSAATRRLCAPTSEPSNNNLLPQVFELAVRLVGLDGDELECGLSQVIEMVANRFGAQQAALIKLGTNQRFACEVEFAKSGRRRVSELIECQTDEAHRHFAVDLTEWPSDIHLDDSFPRYFGGKPQLGTAISVKSATHCGDATVALLLCGVGAIEQLDEDTLHSLRTLSQLVFATRKRLVSARSSEETTRALNKMALAGRATLSLAHEFNNALYSVSCVADVMLMSAAESSPARKNLEDIKKAVNRAASLARRLAAFGKPCSTTTEIVDLIELLTSFGPILQSILGPKVKLKLELGSAPARTWTSRSVVEQLLLESILSARPSASIPHELVIRVAGAQEVTQSSQQGQPGNRPPLCRLTIGASNAGRFWTISDSCELQNLLETLKQMGASVSRCDAQIEVEFLSAPASFPAPGETTGIASERTASGTVLCVEDDDVLRRATAHILSRAGYEVLEAESYSRAAEILSAAKQPIAALVTDVMLPDGNGVLLYQQLLERQPNGKAVFVSGHGLNILKEHGLVGNGHGFLQKPCRAAELPRLLQHLLAQVDPDDSTYVPERK